MAELYDKPYNTLAGRGYRGFFNHIFVILNIVIWNISSDYPNNNLIIYLLPHIYKKIILDEIWRNRYKIRFRI